MERTAEGHIKEKQAPIRPEPAAPLTVAQRLELLEKRVAALEAKKE